MGSKLQPVGGDHEPVGDDPEPVEDILEPVGEHWLLLDQVSKVYTGWEPPQPVERKFS